MQNQAQQGFMWTPEFVTFAVCGVLAVLGALFAVSAKNPIRGAMGLLLLILSVAGLFAVLSAHFLAAIQLIVYAGAIVVLFLFVIMLLGPSAVSAKGTRGIIIRAISGGAFGLLGLAAMYMVVRSLKAPTPPGPAPAGFGTFDEVGWTLFTKAVVPFELSAALLMVAVVGALAVAKSPRNNNEESAESPSAKEIGG